MKKLSWLSVLDNPLSRERALRGLEGTAKFASGLFKLLFWVCLVYAAVSVVFVAFFVLPKFASQEVAVVVGGETGSLLLAGAKEPAATVTLIASDGSTFVGRVISILINLWIFRRASRAFATIAKTRRPFERSHALLLRKISVALLFEGCCANVVGSIVASVLAALLAQGSYSIWFTWDTAIIVTAVSLFAISLVFEYGCALQEQDDCLL